MRLPALALTLFLAAPVQAATPEATAARAEAKTALAEGRIDDARAALKRATTADPSFVEAWVELGNTSLTAGDLATAIEALRKALQLRADQTLPRYNLAYALRKQGRYAEAAQEYQTYLSSNKNDADAHYGLAESLRLSGDPLAAADAYETYAATEKRPEQEKWVQKARATAAELRAQAGVPAKPAAKPDLAAAAKRETPSLTAEPKKISLTKAAPVSEAPAPAPVSEAPSARPESFSAGLNQLKAGDFAGALIRLQVALSERPDDPMILAGVGSAQLGSGDAEAAEKSFLEAQRLAPAQAQAPLALGLGEAQRAQGRTAEAVAAYRKALASNPDAVVKRLADERLLALGAR